MLLLVCSQRKYAYRDAINVFNAVSTITSVGQYFKNDTLNYYPQEQDIISQVRCCYEVLQNNRRAEDLGAANIRSLSQVMENVATAYLTIAFYSKLQSAPNVFATVRNVFAHFNFVTASTWATSPYRTHPQPAQDETLICVCDGNRNVTNAFLINSITLHEKLTNLCFLMEKLANNQYPGTIHQGNQNNNSIFQQSDTDWPRIKEHVLRVAKFVKINGYQL